MSAGQVIFLLVGAVTLGSGIEAVNARKMLHAALWLVLSLLGVAFIFALLEASFFAVVQVLVYIGAIAILIIFAVMLSRSSLTDEGTQTNPRWWLAALGLLILFVGICAAILLWPKVTSIPAPLPASATDLATLGKELVNPNGYLVPFELSSILLLATLVGAIYTAVEKKEEIKK